MAIKKEKTAEQKLVAIKRFLNREIKYRKGILDDEFLQSNMQEMELSYYALQLSVYEKVLKELDK